MADTPSPSVAKQGHSTVCVCAEGQTVSLRLHSAMIEREKEKDREGERGGRRERKRDREKGSREEEQRQGRRQEMCRRW